MLTTTQLEAMNVALRAYYEATRKHYPLVKEIADPAIKTFTIDTMISNLELASAMALRYVATSRPIPDDEFELYLATLRRFIAGTEVMLETPC